MNLKRSLSSQSLTLIYPENDEFLWERHICPLLFLLLMFMSWMSSRCLLPYRIFTDSPFFQWVCVDGHQFEFHMEPQFDNLSTFKGGLANSIASNATVEWPKVHQFLWKVKKSQWGSDKTLPVMVFVLTSFSINIFATFHFQSHTSSDSCKPFQSWKNSKLSRHICARFLEKHCIVFRVFSYVHILLVFQFRPRASNSQFFMYLVLKMEN